MPYYIYRVRGPKQLEYLDVEEKYREAKSRVKDLRAAQADDDEAVVRMIFAKTAGEAEKLLSIPKDDRVIGDF